MFSSSQFRATYDAPEHYPSEVHIHSFENGSVRVHRRGRYHRIDRWYKSFDEVLSLVENLVNSPYFRLHQTKELEPEYIVKRRRVDWKSGNELLAWRWQKNAGIILKGSSLAKCPF